MKNRAALHSAFFEHISPDSCWPFLLLVFLVLWFIQILHFITVVHVHVSFKSKVLMLFDVRALQCIPADSNMDKNSCVSVCPALL